MKAFSIVALVVSVACASGSLAQENVPKKLVIGTRHAPPFSIKGDDGSWSGMSIDLWREIAGELKLEYEFREVDLAAMIQGVQRGDLDAAVAALTITAERERVLDFTQPFYTTGLGIAVPRHGREIGWWSAARALVSVDFLKVVAVLIVVLVAAAFLVWILERKRNAAQFGGEGGKGLGHSLWWAAVTMTTVGYGDKAPVTVGGRLVATVWMFASLVIIAMFTAHITSLLTVSHIEGRIRGPEDLPRHRIATVADTTSERYLRGINVPVRTFSNAREALEAVARGEADAAVYDAPILQYIVSQEMDGRLQVLPRTFERQDYGIALGQGSALREAVNVVLLERIASPWWRETKRKYLGE
jgi:ABC-type amino acid transport substrate-binding protein